MENTIWFTSSLRSHTIKTKRIGAKDRCRRGYLVVQWSGLCTYMTGALVWSLVGEFQSCKLWASTKKKKKKVKKRKKGSHIDQWNRTETGNRFTSIYGQMNFNKDVKVNIEKIEVDVNSKWDLQHWEGSSEKEHSIFKEGWVKQHDTGINESKVGYRE